MEGGVMQARTHRDVAYFDRAVAQLKEYFVRLQAESKGARVESIRKRRRK